MPVYSDGWVTSLIKLDKITILSSTPISLNFSIMIYYTTADPTVGRNITLKDPELVIFNYL